MGSNYQSLFLLTVLCSAWLLAGANKAAAGHEHHNHGAPKVEQVQPVVEIKHNEQPSGAEVKIEEPQPPKEEVQTDGKKEKRGLDTIEEESDEEYLSEENVNVQLLQRKQPQQLPKKKKHTKTKTTTTTTTQPEITPPTTRRTTTTTRPPTTQPEPTTPTTTRKKFTTTTRPPTTQPEPTTPTTTRKKFTTTTRPPTTQPEPTTPTTTRKKFTTTTRRPTTQPEPTTPTTTRTTTRPHKMTTTRRTTLPNPTTPTRRTTTTRRTTQPEPTTPHPTKRRTTTTRRTPTTQPNPTEPPSSTDVCLSCADRRNQKDYYANPADCHSFYHCFFFNETFAVGILQNCPPGTFWSDEVLQCLLEGPVPCFDQCRDDAVAAAGCHGGNGGNCAEFFQCSNGASQPFCCPAFTRFEQATCSCVADETCTDVCTLPTAIFTTVAPPQLLNATTCIDSFGITLSAVPGNPSQFIIIDNSDPENVINNLANCAVGTEFDVETCRCNTEVELPMMPLGRQCSLWLPFNTDLQDHSIERFTTFAYGDANLDTTAAAQGAGSLFVNRGRLEIPGMKNYDFGHAASWCMFFRCQNGGTNTCSSSGGLFSNNNNSSMTDYSIIMATQPTNTFTGRVNFRAPRGSATVSTPVNSPTPGWNQVCVTYDSETVRLYLNGNVVDSEPGTGGYIALGHCPYVVGTDQTFGDFTGNIDEVLACPFVLTQEEITAHFQGNTAFLASEGLIPSNGVSRGNNGNFRNVKTHNGQNNQNQGQNQGQNQS